MTQPQRGWPWAGFLPPSPWVDEAGRRGRGSRGRCCRRLVLRRGALRPAVVDCRGRWRLLGAGSLLWRLPQNALLGSGGLAAHACQCSWYYGKSKPGLDHFLGRQTGRQSILNYNYTPKVAVAKYLWYDLPWADSALHSSTWHFGMLPANTSQRKRGKSRRSFGEEAAEDWLLQVVHVYQIEPSYSSCPPPTPSLTPCTRTQWLTLSGDHSQTAKADVLLNGLNPKPATPLLHRGCGLLVGSRASLVHGLHAS